MGIHLIFVCLAKKFIEVFEPTYLPINSLSKMELILQQPEVVTKIKELLLF
jgi:hypothetical protein